MKEKKNIDRIFQEKFKDFEASPHPNVWKGIKKDLQQKDKKTIPLFPLWAKLSGVAALLAVLFFVGKSWLFKIPDSNPIKTVDSRSITAPADTAQPKPAAPLKPLQNTSLTQTTEKEDQAPTSSSSNKSSSTVDIAHSSKENMPFEKEDTQRSFAKEEPVLFTKRPKDFLLPIPIGIDDYFNLAGVYEKSTLQKEEKVTTDSTQSGKSLFDEIARQQKDHEESKQEAESSQRFALQPNIAPVYYSSIGGGSALDPQFAENSTKGKVTTSYGINFDYRISNRIQLRSGISKVNLQYNTPDIAYLSSQPSMGIRALNTHNKINNTVIISTVSRKTNAQVSPQSNAKIMTASAYTEGELHQEMSYLEIPLEMVYTLVDQRFGIHLVGGTSALVLNNDNIQIQSALETQKLGRAENINSMSFTGNLGVGFSYRLSQFLDINMEPTFKYQFNGFSGKTGDFKPYYLGLYSGVRFKF